MHKLLSIFAILLVYALGSIAGGANPDDSAANLKFKPSDRVWTTADLKVRSDPGLDSEQIDSMADGNSMIKGNTGIILEGPVSKDEYTWWKISYDIGITGWSAEKYLELITAGPKQPDNFAQWGDDAVKWATDKDHIGSRNWNGECLRFVSNAFRQKGASGESGWSTAINAARDLYRFNQEQGGWQYAPKGAVIFFDKKGTNPDGHVSIYLGDGKNIINAYGTVQEISIEDAMAKGDVGKYIGWSYPPEAWRPETSSESQSNEPTGKIESTNAMSSESKSTSAYIESTGQSETDFTITPANVQNKEVFHVVIVGDSIAWGAGLNKEEKYSYLVAKWLAEQLSRSVNVKVLAHIGANLCTETSDPIRPPDLSSGNPTLSQQADTIQDPNNVDLILVSGGINDVKVDNIIKLDHLENPTDIWNDVKSWWGKGTYSIKDIRELADNLEGPMHILLNKLSKECPKAKIVVTSYYPIISDNSKSLTDTIKSLYPKSQQVTDYQKMDEPSQKSQLSVKSNAFYEESTKSFKAAVDGANSDSGDNRVAFAQIVFLPENCYGADQSLLWKIGNFGGQIKTDDNMFDNRMTLLNDLGWVCACEQCLTPPGTKIPQNVDCDAYRSQKFNAVGHPNEKGAIKYKDTIIKTISDAWPNWLNSQGQTNSETIPDNIPPEVKAFRLSPLSLNAGESITIDYTVHDNGGSGLKQVELWRKNETSDWQQIKINTLSSENVPGTFIDSPSAPGKYWYGLHVINNAGNWNDEKNSNSNYQPGIYGPLEVEVTRSIIPSSKIALNKAGDILWRRTFGSSSSSNSWIDGDQGNSVQQTNDGGYIICGSCSRNYGWVTSSADKIWLIKTDANGNELWNRTFERWDDNDAVGNSAQQTSDGGYVIIGSTIYNSVVDYKCILQIKTDANGNELWNRTIGTRGNSTEGNSIQQTSDGGYIIIGAIEPNPFSSFKGCAWLIKTDNKGNVLWDKTLQGSSGNSIQQTSDGGYIIAGTKDDNDWLIKTDQDGNKQWDRTFIDSKNSWLRKGFRSVQQTINGGYILADETSLLKTDANGNKLWDWTLNDSNGRIFGGHSARLTIDGGYIAVGENFLIKTNANGKELWNNSLDGSNGNSIQLTSDSGYIIAGNVQDNDADIVLIRIKGP
jgi:hypothetical protein